jgi:hypothetical protein
VVDCVVVGAGERVERIAALTEGVLADAVVSAGRRNLYQLLPPVQLVLKSVCVGGRGGPDSEVAQHLDCLG